MKNYHGVMELHAVLSSSHISRLRQSWKLVSPVKLLTFARIDTLMSPSSNYREYRKVVDFLLVFHSVFILFSFFFCFVLFILVFILFFIHFSFCFLFLILVFHSLFCSCCAMRRGSRVFPISEPG
jgi:hypothetical protein